MHPLHLCALLGSIPQHRTRQDAREPWITGLGYSNPQHQHH